MIIVVIKTPTPIITTVTVKQEVEKGGEEKEYLYIISLHLGHRLRFTNSKILFISITQTRKY